MINVYSKIVRTVIIDVLIDGQISSFCPDQSGLRLKLLTLIMLHKLTQSL